MAYDKGLAERIRDALAATPSVREVRMFGGLSFLARDSIVVSATRDGGLLVRADPERAPALLSITGAQPAKMGSGRAMRSGWINVAEATIASDEALGFWIGVALEYNEKQSGSRSRGRRQAEPR